MGRITRVELQDVNWRESTTISHELNEAYFREIASRTTKLVLNALREVWAKHKNISWNHIVGAGTTVYSLLRKGITDNNTLVGVVKAYLQSKGYTNVDEAAKNIVAAVRAAL